MKTTINVSAIIVLHVPVVEFQGPRTHDTTLLMILNHANVTTSALT